MRNVQDRERLLDVLISYSDGSTHKLILKESGPCDQHVNVLLRAERVTIERPAALGFFDRGCSGWPLETRCYFGGGATPIPREVQPFDFVQLFEIGEPVPTKPVTLIWETGRVDLQHTWCYYNAGTHFPLNKVSHVFAPKGFKVILYEEYGQSLPEILEDHVDVDHTYDLEDIGWHNKVGLVGVWDNISRPGEDPTWLQQQK
jgi:hypothetical protein